MSKKNIKISYDSKSKVLSIELGRGKSVDSDIQENVVLDYDGKGKIVRINLYDFSFSEFRSHRLAFKQFSRELLLVPRR